MSRRWAALVLVLVAAASGCGGVEMPPLFPATGRVVKDGLPVQGGRVIFTPVGVQAEILIAGTVSETGIFELTTRKGGAQGSGAPEGTYQVTYSPPKILKGGPLPVNSQKTYKVEARPNEFTFDIGGAKPF